MAKWGTKGDLTHVQIQPGMVARYYPANSMISNLCVVVGKTAQKVKIVSWELKEPKFGAPYTVSPGSLRFGKIGGTPKIIKKKYLYYPANSFVEFTPWWYAPALTPQSGYLTLGQGVPFDVHADKLPTANSNEPTFENQWFVGGDDSHPFDCSCSSCKPVCGACGEYDDECECDDDLPEPPCTCPECQSQYANNFVNAKVYTNGAEAEWFALTRIETNHTVKQPDKKKPKHRECGKPMVAVGDGRYQCVRCTKAGYLFPVVKEYVG